MGKRKTRSALEDATLVNNATYFDYLERFKKIALSLFEWTNLPESMDARFLERCLYYTGQAAMLYLEPYGYINTKSATAGNLNLYGLPTQIRCYSYGQINENRNVFYGKTTGTDEGDESARLGDQGEDKNTGAILVLNNWEGMATANTIELFAYRMYTVERAIDVNIKAQKTPYIVLTNEDERLSMVNAMNQIDKNAMMIVGEKNTFDPNAIRTLNTQAPYIADKLTDYKHSIWNEFLTFMGVDNISEKRERMISAETMSNNECVNLNLQSYLQPRLRAAKQFNEKYGMNVEVKLRSDIYNIIKSSESIVMDSLDDKAVEDIEKLEVANG